MRWPVIALILSLAGCELTADDSAPASACAGDACRIGEQAGAPSMSTPPAQAGARPPIDSRPTARAETATFGLG